MGELAGLPYFRVEITKDGKIFKQEQVTEALNGLGGATDLFVVSHGWNNNTQEAQELYDELLGNIKPRLGALAGRKFAVIGIFWPSKKFTDEELQPGGGASFGGATEADVQKQLDRVEELGGDSTRGDVAKARAAAHNLGDPAK